ncbi:hypothetical protein ADICEAN_01782 [Cesiribacter andamanensis AMV16]|uniref:Uncharacterized protein n=1 Tax=Cesiribacter andamanensis AMV16 TaxID=1279009 RepID=M7N2Z4_9BACT|nr:hypothetical protein ADICEAN_01782 [Cesiribacter andamanensis AMV16]
MNSTQLPHPPVVGVFTNNFLDMLHDGLMIDVQGRMFIL